MRKGRFHLRLKAPRVAITSGAAAPPGQRRSSGASLPGSDRSGVVRNRALLTRRRLASSAATLVQVPPLSTPMAFIARFSVISGSGHPALDDGDYQMITYMRTNQQPL